MSKRRVNMKLLSAHLCTPPTSSRLHTYTIHTHIYCFYVGFFFHFCIRYMECNIRVTLLFVFSLCAKCCEMYKLMMIYDSEPTKSRRKERHRKRKREWERDGTLSFVAYHWKIGIHVFDWKFWLFELSYYVHCTPNQRYMHTYSKHTHTHESLGLFEQFE